MAIATKKSWKIKHPPKKKKKLAYDTIFTDSDAEQIMKGFIPSVMEEKWFIYYEDGWLYLHRSWTGALIYWIKLDGSPLGARVVESDQTEYKQTDIEYDRQILDYLIRRILLKQEAEIPNMKKVNSSLSQRIFHHSILGNISEKLKKKKPPFFKK
jgi:hypothetical protein